MEKAWNWFVGNRPIVIFTIALVLINAGVIAFFYGGWEYRLEQLDDELAQVHSESKNREAILIEIAEKSAWLEGYESCKNDVFRSWLDRATPAPVPKLEPTPTDGQ